MQGLTVSVMLALTFLGGMKLWVKVPALGTHWYAAPCHSPCQHLEAADSQRTYVSENK